MLVPILLELESYDQSCMSFHPRHVVVEIGYNSFQSKDPSNKGTSM